MYLKRLYIQGFKSFPNRTQLEFTPGVTAIVGPNGCGKSNICDAIKWVLGEQKVKSLRSQKMEDVIFNGSKLSGPAGFSEVTLVFDNHDKAIPDGLDEIPIMRSLFRTGESVYNMNRSQCRRKDIQEMLWGTGLGKSAYSVIEQGQIDQIINAAPVQKRALLEEAAGITKYKFKKREALVQLEGVEQDLCRLNDLVSEIKSHMATLKEQADTAIRFKQYKEELEKLELVYYYKEYNRIKDEIRKTEASIEKYIEKVEELEDQLENFGEQNESDRSKALEIQSTYERYKEEQIKAENEIKHQQRYIRNLEKQITETTSQLEINKEEIQIFQDEYEAVDEKIGRKDQFDQAIDEKIIQTKAELEDKQQELKQLEGSNANYIGDFEEFQDQITKIQEELNRIETELAVEQNQKENHKRNEQQLISQNSKLQQRSREIERDIDRLKQQASSEADHESLNEYNQCKEELKELLRAKTTNENKLVQLRSQIGKLESQYHVIKKAEENHEGFFRGIQFLLRLKAESPEQYSGVIGVVADLLIVPQKYQVPIEVALGGALQYIIVKNARIADQCIALLKRNQIGRVTFIPLDMIRPAMRNGKIDHIARAIGIIGEAIELIDFDYSIQKAVEYLLQNTLITQDLNTAIDWKKKGYNFKYVSKEGEIINPSGLISGGSPKRSGLLERKGDVEQLKRQIQRLKPELAKVEKNIIRDNEKIESRKQKLEELDQDLEGYRNKMNEQQHHLRYLEREKEQLTSQITQVKHQLAQSFINKGKFDERRIHLENRTVELQGSQKEVQRKKAEFENKYMGQSKELKDKLNEVTNIRIKIHSLEEQKERYLQDFRYQNKELDRLKNAIIKITSNNQKMVEKLSELGKNKQNLIDGISDKEKQLFEANKRLTEIAKEKVAVNSLLNKIAEEISQIKRNQNNYQNKLNEARISLSRWETKMEDLSLRVKENFDVALTDLSFEEEDLKSSLSAIGSRISRLKEKINMLGEINVLAIEEYEATQKRYDFILGQEKDLLKSKRLLLKTIEEIDTISTELFSETYHAVRTYFQDIFRRLFRGGQADLILLDKENMLETGIDIIARPPGKKPQSISLLSGGEKALTAIALMFGLFSYRPSPFCILDEIDAPLDEHNVVLLAKMLKEYSKATQFFVITHNKRTMEIADTIYGVTMNAPGESQVLSMSLQDISPEYIEAT